MGLAQLSVGGAGLDTSKPYRGGSATSGLQSKGLGMVQRAPTGAGVTSVVDMGQFPLSEEASFATLEQVYRHAADSGSLPVRVQAMVPLRSWQATHLQRLETPAPQHRRPVCADVAHPALQQ